MEKVKDQCVDCNIPTISFPYIYMYACVSIFLCAMAVTHLWNHLTTCLVKALTCFSYAAGEILRTAAIESSQQIPFVNH